MTHAHAFSLDRAISDALLPYTASAPNPVNLPESAHPTLFAVEPGPDDHEEAIREDERRAARQIHLGLTNQILALQDELREKNDLLALIADRADAAVHPIRN